MPKKKLGQCPAILISRLVNSPYLSGSQHEWTLTPEKEKTTSRQVLCIFFLRLYTYGLNRVV